MLPNCTYRIYLGKVGLDKEPGGASLMPRDPRLDVPTTLHRVSVRGTEKDLIVREDTDRQAFVARRRGAETRMGTSVHAWALCPNHVYLSVRSGTGGFSSFRRLLLTGDAITFNKHHGRHGHLFENRYKSVVCDEDSYF